MQAWMLMALLLSISISIGTPVQCSAPKCMQLHKLLSEHKLPLHRPVPTPTEASHTYCYKGSDPYTLSALLHVWDAMVISIATEAAPSLVQLFRMENDTLNTAHGSSHLVLSPFGESYVEVRRADHTPLTSDEVEYNLKMIKTLPLYYPGLLAIGLVLFFIAPSLSRNIGVYYSTSVLLGVVMSLLLLLFIFYRMVPKSSVVGWGVLLGGSSVVASVLYYGFVNFVEILQQYWPYVVGYGVFSGLVTFGVVYRWGPPDPRTMNLLQWGTQLVATVMIYLSFHQLPWVALTGIALLSISGFFSNFICWMWNTLCSPICCCLTPVTRCLSFFNPFKPRYPKRRLLTMEEYDAVGEVETKLALENLRKHCRNSLKNNNEIWGTVSKLQDPKRFTEFLSGKSHVTDEEQAEHEFSFIVEENTDDESETTNSSVPSPNPSPVKNTTSRPPVHRNIHATRTI